MSCIVDRDRGRSVLMSGIVWCYLESLVTTRLRAFHRISLSNQGQSRECGQVTRGLVRINDFYRVSHSRHHSSNHLWWEKTKSWQLRSKSILDICYGCSDHSLSVFIWHLVSWLLGRRFILWQTIPGDTEPAWRVASVSLTPRTVSSLVQTGIMLPANNERRVTRQLASQETR